MESLDATKTFEPIEPIVETDIHSFLKNERENAILATIEETKRKTFENAEKNFWNSLEDEWEREKQKILNSLLTAGKETMLFPLDTNRFEELIFTKGRSSLTALEMSFARQLFVCNETSIQKQNSSFLDAFKQVGQKCEDQNAKNLWLLLDQLVNDIPSNDQNVRKLRQSNVFQAMLVKSSKKFLEDRYRVFIEKCVFDNLQQACLGGVPGLYNLVLSYLKIKLSTNLSGFEDGTINGVPVWPLVYFCLRCGDVKATEQAAEALPPQYSDFKTFLKEFLASPDCRLHPNNEAKLRLQYKRSIRTSSDPFKRILFCIIGQCDNTESHPEVIKKTEDYLWLKLNQVQLEDSLQHQESVTLQNLQKLLLEDYGKTFPNFMHHLPCILLTEFSCNNFKMCTFLFR